MSSSIEGQRRGTETIGLIETGYSWGGISHPTPYTLSLESRNYRIILMLVLTNSLDVVIVLELAL